MKPIIPVLISTLIIALFISGSGYSAEDNYQVEDQPAVNLNDTGNKTLSIETNPLTWLRGPGLPVSVSYFTHMVSLNLAYQHVGTPMSMFDSLGIDASGYGVEGGVSFYPKHERDGFNSFYGEVSYGYATMEAESGETSIEVQSHGPSLGIGYRIISGHFTLRFGAFGGYYFSTVKDNNYTKADEMTAETTGMMYGFLASAGIIF